MAQIDRTPDDERLIRVLVPPMYSADTVVRVLLQTWKDSYVSQGCPEVRVEAYMGNTQTMRDKIERLKVQLSAYERSAEHQRHHIGTLEQQLESYHDRTQRSTQHRIELSKENRELRKKIKNVEEQLDALTRHHESLVEALNTDPSQDSPEEPEDERHRPLDNPQPGQEPWWCQVCGGPCQVDYDGSDGPPNWLEKVDGKVVDGVDGGSDANDGALVNEIHFHGAEAGQATVAPGPDPEMLQRELTEAQEELVGLRQVVAVWARRQYR